MEFKLKFFSRTYLRFYLSNLLVFGAETFLEVTPKETKQEGETRYLKTSARSGMQPTLKG
jgi:hypothetical protein